MTRQVSEYLEHEGIRFSLTPFPVLPDRHPRLVTNPLLEYSALQAVASGSLPVEQFESLFGGQELSRERSSLVLERCCSGMRAKAELDEMRAAGQMSVVHSTANWRMYQGAWALEQGRLYLVHLSLRLSSRVLDGPEPVLADWITGEYVGGYGELVCRTRDGDPSWSRRRSFRFDRGTLVAERELEPIPDDEVQEWLRYSETLEDLLAEKTASLPSEPSFWNDPARAKGFDSDDRVTRRPARARRIGAVIIVALVVLAAFHWMS